jgi:peptidyl-tRNA hydrolase
VELREDLAAGKAALEAQTRVAAAAAAELTLTKRKLADAAAARSDADALAARLAAEVAHSKGDAVREAEASMELRRAVQAAREDAARARQWREAQVRCSGGACLHHMHAPWQWRRRLRWG